MNTAAAMRQISTKQEASPGEEARLRDYSVRLAQHLGGRRAVRVHLSRLRPYNRLEHHIRIAINTFDSLLQKFDGQRFLLVNRDLVIVVADASVADIDRVILKLRFLFSDDPLLAEDQSSDGVGLCTWYEMPRDYQAFRVMAADLAKQAEQRRHEPQLSGERGNGPTIVETLAVPLDPTRLARLEQTITTLDLTPMVRRQAICAIVPGLPPRPIFAEYYISIEDLGHRLMPDVDLLADRWLFQRLSQSLDTNFLNLLPAIAANSSTTLNVNINISTLLSPQFLQFDARFRLVGQKAIVFELQSIDVFGDMGSYMFARDFARDRGYRLCLDGLSHLTFPLIRRDQLGLDMEKIAWARHMENDLSADRQTQLHDAVRHAGAGRVILYRCDSPGAIEFGQKLGITLFQGHFVDRLLEVAAENSGAQR